MLTKRILTAALVLFISASAALAQQSINNPMAKAVLDVYDELLKENPNDWETLMNRANEYYNYSEYMRALNDIDKALALIPENNKPDRMTALLLRANIYVQTDRLPLALNDFNSAVALFPTNYTAINQRANCLYMMGDYKEASVDYKRLQRLDPRSVEALVGLARVAVKENNLGLANELLDRAVSMDPTNAEYYVRRASVRRTMGNHAGAVEDLILGMSSDSRNTRVTQALLDYGNENYAAVITGLTSAMEQAPRVDLYIYLRAAIAQQHYHFKAALADYQRILDEKISDYQGLYASMAECQFALGKYEEALENVNIAIDALPETASYFVLKAQILRALGRPVEAFPVALRASALNPGGADELVEMGLCRADDNRWEEAAGLFAEASMESQGAPMPLMLRAWVLEQHLNQPVAAKNFYEQVTDLDTYKPDDVRSLHGFALLFLGKKAEADTWMSEVLSAKPDNDGELNYMAACYYCAAGDNDRAIECATRSLDAGYADYYNWMRNTDGRINVAPLRDDLRFLNLIERHRHLFE